VAVRCNVEPAQIGLSFPAVGAEGVALTLIVRVPLTAGQVVPSVVNVKVRVTVPLEFAAGV
jgi:hypothetical protein